MFKRRSLRGAVLLAVALSLALLGITVGVGSVAIANATFRADRQSKLQTDFQNLLRDWDQKIERLKSMMAWFESSVRVRDAIARKDVQGALELGRLIMSSFELDFATFVDARGVVLARAHEPERRGDSIADQASVLAALRGQRLTLLEEGAVVGLSIRGAIPIRNPTGEVIGALILGWQLGSEAFVDHWAQLTGAELALFRGNTRLMTTIRDPSGKRIVGTPLNNPAIESLVLGRGETYFGLSTIQGAIYQAAYHPIRDATNRIIGMIFMGYPVAEIEATTQRIAWTAAGLTLSIIFLTLIVLILFLNSRLLSPLARTEEVLQRLSEGKEARVPARFLSRYDEIGRMARSLDALSTYLEKNAATANAIAGGILDQEAHLASAEDRFGLAFRAMIEGLNELIHTIQTAVAEVTQGVSQISEGTQALSASSNQSAASLTEMNSHVKEVLAFSQENARAAQQASKASSEVKQAADRSIAQVQELSQSVLDIVASAKDIQKVIKTIDDIAFQVNLLALNASVEAARAGKHGKGFAVVADEVRALAGRSAAAAKNTAELINKVLERINMGFASNEVTVHEIRGMVTQVQELLSINQDIARRSQEQVKRLEQISIASDQIEKAIHDISATAEQTAAASQEINSMASLLQRTAARFRTVARTSVGNLSPAIAQNTGAPASSRKLLG